MSEFDALLLRNIEIMNDLQGFNVVIICCSSAKQAEYWQKRLEKGRGSILPKDSTVLAVEEDWPGGAGNALGTLYAFTKASKVAKENYNMDIMADLTAHKISVGLYHTAGKGTRLAPLPGSENNNKPGVKLPTTIPIGGEPCPITILEAVIKQTSCYASSRLGRLSVFWGDQVFIPTAPVHYNVEYHVDILCSLGPMMSEQEWKEKGMDKYGLIAKSASGSAAQVEKVDHATAVQLLSSIGEIQSVGASLGSFSVSWQILDALLHEFAQELANKSGKLDSDPHLWMPMTLDVQAYVHLMKQKGVSEEVSVAHHSRISKMMVDFLIKYKTTSRQIFGPVDVGQGVYWWDYGQLKLYLKYTRMMTEDTRESQMMRLFLGIQEDQLVKDSTIVNTQIDNRSCISSCELGSEQGNAGFVKNCVMSNVRCKYIEAEDCVLINVTADRIIAKPHSIIYNTASAASSNEVTSNGTIELNEKDVLVGVFDADGNQFVLKSHMDTDGGKAWEVKVAGNDKSFEEVYNFNADACPTTLEQVIAASHKGAWESYSGKL